MKKIILSLAFLLFFTSNLCYAYEFMGVSLDMDKDSAISSLLHQEYALIEQATNENKQTLKFKRKDMVMVEFINNRAMNIVRKYNG